jgi:flagellar protein FlaJ
MALLKIQFLDTMAGLAETSGEAASETEEFSQAIDPDLLSMLFFHAVTLQALISSFIAGYIRNVEIISGVKYAVALATVALVTWVIVEQISEGNTEGGEALLLLVGSAGWSLWDRDRPTDADHSRGNGTPVVQDHKRT